ncbi:MAG: hypothetical protein R2860_13830 [Desulfobacterales bacterium]
MIAIIVLMGFSVSLVFFRVVPLKMLPFDNKNEFQVVIDMPEGTTLKPQMPWCGNLKIICAGSRR